MALTPLDIRRNEFARSFRGYNHEEVESFLALVADEVEKLIGDNRDLNRRVVEVEKEIEEYRRIERTLMDTLLSAQRTADDKKESTERESELIKREAKVRSDQLMENARIEAERLLMEARRQAHIDLENARHKAHETIETAQKRADELYRAAKADATALEQQTAVLRTRRDAFVKNIRAHLKGQLEAVEALSGEPAPMPEPKPPSKLEKLSREDTEALAEIDRELSEFAAGQQDTGKQDDDDLDPAVTLPAIEPPTETSGRNSNQKHDESEDNSGQGVLVEDRTDRQ